MGRTPHELHDEMCMPARAFARLNPQQPPRPPFPRLFLRRLASRESPMAINLVELRARPLDPEIEDELARFERARRAVPGR